MTQRSPLVSNDTVYKGVCRHGRIIMHVRFSEDLDKVRHGLLLLLAPNVHGTSLCPKEEGPALSAGNLLAILEVAAQSTPQGNRNGILLLAVVHSMDALHVS